MPIINFGKVSIISEHIYSVYNDKILCREILSDILVCLKDGISYG